MLKNFHYFQTVFAENWTSAHLLLLKDLASPKCSSFTGLFPFSLNTCNMLLFLICMTYFYNLVLHLCNFLCFVSDLKFKITIENARISKFKHCFKQNCILFTFYTMGQLFQNCGFKTLDYIKKRASNCSVNALDSRNSMWKMCNKHNHHGKLKPCTAFIRSDW